MVGGGSEEPVSATSGRMFGSAKITDVEVNERAAAVEDLEKTAGAFWQSIDKKDVPLQ